MIIAAGVVEIFLGLVLSFFLISKTDVLFYGPWQVKMIMTGVCFVTFSFIINGVGILFLKDWARKITVTICYVLIFIVVAGFSFVAIKLSQYPMRGGMSPLFPISLGVIVFLTPLIGMCLVLTRPKNRVRFQGKMVNQVDVEVSHPESHCSDIKVCKPKWPLIKFEFPSFSQKEWVFIIVAAVLLLLLSLPEMLFGM